MVNESLIQRKNRLKYGAYIDREVKQEIKEELLNNEDVTPETVSKVSKRLILIIHNVELKFISITYLEKKQKVERKKI